MLASAFMTVAVPKVAGVERVVACAPPYRSSGVHPAMLHAMAASGADQIVCLGGVQALAAMAFGLVRARAGRHGRRRGQRLRRRGQAPAVRHGRDRRARRADRGGRHRRRLGRPGADRDGPARPGRARPDVALSADLHLRAARARGARRGRRAAAALADARRRRPGLARPRDGRRRRRTTPRRCGCPTTTRPSTSRCTSTEHKLDAYLDGLRNYGSLFLGAEATVAYGDKAVGTNHVLPTMGAARFTGGLWVGKFLKTCTYQRLTGEGTRAVAPAVAAIAHAERFAGHARTAEIRLDGDLVTTPFGLDGRHAAHRRAPAGASAPPRRSPSRPRAPRTLTLLARTTVRGRRRRGSRARARRRRPRRVLRRDRRARAAGRLRRASTRSTSWSTRPDANVPQALGELDLATADRLWAVNVRAGLHAAREARPPDARQRRRDRLHLVADGPRRRAARRSVYCATKHAVEGLTRALAVELAPRGVRVVVRRSDVRRPPR